jgi:hypothetical protein
MLQENLQRPKSKDGGRSKKDTAGPVGFIIQQSTSSKLNTNCVISRSADFWLTGGISIIAWLFSLAAYFFSNTNQGFDRLILTWPMLFLGLTIVCNHPHFISSYRIAYGNGSKRILLSWFTLIVVPVLLVALFLASYKFSHQPSSDHKWIAKLFWISNSADLGIDLLRASVWLMWATVGWHYAKQAFGISLRYAGYDRYPLSNTDRNILKFTLLSVVPINVMAMLNQMAAYPTYSAFQDLPMRGISTAPWLGAISFWIPILLLFVCCLCFAKIYGQTKKLPSINFLVPFVTFYLWWYPGLWPLPYAMIMIPFFHSLQYLPFAYQKMNSELDVKKSKNLSRAVTLNIFFILVVGISMFDLIPNYLDTKLEMRSDFGASFFLVAFVVFINVHHFFIDSSIWKSKNKLAQAN